MLPLLPFMLLADVFKELLKILFDGVVGRLEADDEIFPLLSL
jgi:hypothetical protein